MWASLTFPPNAHLISGENPAYIGNVNRGESRTVNWTIVFMKSGEWLLDVNASGYRADIGTYVEKHGSATVTVTGTIPSIPVGGIWIPVDKLGLLAPYISLVSTIVVTTATTGLYAKRVKRRKKK